jgi:murein DD-endopeptidase MepM/ murein hydrolase activator NlpD
MKPRVLFLVLIGGASVAGAVPGTAPGPGPAVVGLRPGSVVPAVPNVEIPADPDQLDRSLATAERAERELRRQLRDLERDDQLARQRSVAFGRAYVQATRAGLLPVAGGFDTFVDHAARVERLRKAAASELATRTRIAERRLALRRQLTDLGSRLAVLRANQQAMAQAHTALLAQQDRAAAFQRAFSDGSAHTAVYGSGAGPLDPTVTAQGFAAMKGTLPFPIAGRTEIRSAERPGIEGPGLEIAAPVGTPVKAVFPGRVAFADEYGPYGKTVIVDHGNRFFSVNAGLGDIGVEVRDEVAAGNRLGAVGLGPSGPGLYFELRRGAETLEPDEWFGL